MNYEAIAAKALNLADDFLGAAAECGEGQAKMAADWSLAAKNCVGAAQHATRAESDQRRLDSDPRIRRAA
jgi:hypothetical protein